jgi:hypothetical protein
MSWAAYFHPRFKAEFDELSMTVQDELLALLVPLREYGPLLGRPEVDTLNESKYANMKELRFKADGGVWRVAFAFDPGETRFSWLPVTNPEQARKSFTSG